MNISILDMQYTHLLAKVQCDLGHNGTSLGHSQTVTRYDHHLLGVTQRLCEKETEKEKEGGKEQK